MLRDALAHDHIWRTRIGWGEQGEFLVAPGRLDRKSGSGAFRRITKSVARTSKTLRLNLSPTTVWRRDVYTVLNVVLGALAWTPLGRRQVCSIAHPGGCRREALPDDG